MFVGRVKEKVLLGEMEADVLTLDALRPQAGSVSGGNSGLFEPFNSTSRSFSSTGGLTRKHTAGTTADGSRPNTVSKEELRNSCVQASEEDLERFTKVTVGQSWVLPNVVKQKSAADTANGDGEDPLTSTQKIKKVNGIAEQSFDDFEPFIVVPRSPRSSKKYRPNLKETPMPPTGPPSGTNKKGDVFQQAPKKKPSSSLNKSRSAPELNKSKKKIEFQEISLKKTTMSKREQASLHHIEKEDDGDRLTTPPDDQASSKRPQSQEGVKKKKKKATNKAATAPAGAFFFPTLLSSAPSINLAPVGSQSVEDESTFLYEDTSLF